MAFLPFEPLTACALTLACVGGPAAPPQTTISLTTQGPNSVSTVTLTCSPLGGTHPDPGEACASLARAAGNFEQLPDKDQACTLIYAPVAAEAVGTYRGKTVNFSTSYPNSCVADARSGGVFGF
jgi:hypothetical protein